MRALVTGFEPFGGESVNASLEAVRALPPRVGPLDVRTARLPTSYARALGVLEAVINDSVPQIVLCVGEAGDRAALCVERVAVNLQDARISDNDGAQPEDVPVIAGGPAAYLATLPVRAAVAALRAAELPAEVSMSAGTFVCNHVFYGLMDLAALRGQPFIAGFVHVPRLPQQRDNAKAMALEDIVRGLAIVLEASAQRVQVPR